MGGERLPIFVVFLAHFITFCADMAFGFGNQRSLSSPGTDIIRAVAASDHADFVRVAHHKCPRPWTIAVASFYRPTVSHDPTRQVHPKSSPGLVRCMV
jgi:hypothetical protein